MNEQMFGHYWARAAERAVNPLPRQSGPHSIAPWLRRL